jgi:glutathione S-transferase
MTYRLFGSVGSPYSIKARSYFRYKDIDHVWLVRNSPELVAEYSKAAKLAIVPTVIMPDGTAVQDSTPMIEKLEAAFPSPRSVYPESVALRFISALLEDFGDEWANKWMMHYRW